MRKFFIFLISITVLGVPAILLAAPGPDCLPGQFCNPFGNGIVTLPKFIEEITNKVILPVGSVVVVVMIIYSGFLFVTAQGNENKLTDAKKAITHAIIGALILLGSWVIANSIKGTICLLYDTPPEGLECSGSDSGDNGLDIPTR